MVQIIPQEQSPFGKIGRGFAKGLSEMLPKEVERYRLSSGLKQFEKEASGLTPLQQYTRLAAIPGFTAEHGYNISPLLRQQAIREESGKMGAPGATAISAPVAAQKERTGVVPVPVESVKGGREKPYEEIGKEAAGKGVLKSLEATRAQLEPIIQRSDQELYSEAAALSRENPNTFPTPQDALPFIRDTENKRIANLQEQRSIGKAADIRQTALKEGLESRWGKENTEKGIPGTVQSKLLRNIESDLADPNNKLSEAQLMDKWGEIGKRIAKADTLLAERANHSLISGNYTPGKILNSIDAARSVYADADSLEEFRDIIQNKFHLGNEIAGYLSYPPSSNREVAKYVTSVKSPTITKHNYPDPREVKKFSIKAADDLIGKIDTSPNSKDSITSIALALKNKGLSAKDFIERINQNRSMGLFEPNARQLEELGKGISFFPSLGDIFLMGSLNYDNLLEPEQ